MSFYKHATFEAWMHAVAVPFRFFIAIFVWTWSCPEVGPTRVNPIQDTNRVKLRSQMKPLKKIEKGPSQK